MKLYLAAPFFTPIARAQTRYVTQLARATGHEIFSPMEESAAIWKGRPPAECSAVERALVMDMNCRGVASADLVLAWLRGTGGPYTDPGVVWELGYAWAKGTPVLGYTVDGERASDVNLMIQECLGGYIHGMLHMEEALRRLRCQTGLDVLPKYSPVDGIDAHRLSGEVTAVA